MVYDYVGLGDADYAIADASAGRSARTLAPVAIVDGIAVHFETSTDIALVHARPEYPDVTVAGRRYNDIPALPYHPVTSPPAVGTRTLSNSAPDLSRRQTRAFGRYLGRHSNTEGTFDAVAIAPNTWKDDPCYYGGSGSLAVTAAGDLLGPLSRRAAFGYPDGYTDRLDSADYQKAWATRIGEDNKLNPQALDLDTICLYATPKPSQIAATSTAFGRYP